MALLQALAPGCEVKQEGGKAGNRRARLTLAGASSVRYAYLDGDELVLRLRLYVGDTMTQARHFYGNESAVSGVLRLRSEGWELTPSFHFGFMAKGLVWTHSSMPVEDYVRYWVNHTETLEWERPECPIRLDELISRGIFDPGDVDIFDAAFTKTKRQTASPRPSLRLSVTTHPQGEQLPGHLAGLLRSALRTLQEPHDFVS